MGISNGSTIGSNNFRHLQFKRGSLNDSVTINVPGPSATSVLSSSFATKPLKGFTLDSQISFNIRCRESATSVNATMSVRYARWRPGSGLSTWAPTSIISQTEMSTIESTITGSLSNPASIQFNDGDALVVQLVIVPIGTFGEGSVVVNWGSSTGVSGNSFIQFQDDFEEKNRVTSCF